MSCSKEPTFWLQFAVTYKICKTEFAGILVWDFFQFMGLIYKVLVSFLLGLLYTVKKRLESSHFFIPKIVYSC